MSLNPAPLSARVAQVVELRVVERLAAIEDDVAKARDGAIAWTFQGIRSMHEAGRLLCETQDLLTGDFTDWFESNAEHIGYSLRTATTYKKVFRDIERLGGFDHACEKFPDRHEFLVALGVLKPRESSDHTTPAPSLPFSIRFKICGPPVEEWEVDECRNFLAETAPLLSIRERAQARLSAV
jgi:hypothetical protein